MRHCTAIGLVFCALGIAGCSYVPSLDQATGTTESKILIGDIVERVKCEISDSFDSVVDEPRFAWLRNWTAKVDLTLQINDQAGVSPNGSYTNYSRNAFNYGAGSTSLTNNTIAAVPQYFTLGLGANYSEQALRAETISFTVSLREMRRWRKHAQSAALALPPGSPLCAATGQELRGHLGLAEWVNSALYPVAVSQLHAGIHPSPLNAGSKPPSPVGPPKGAAAVFIELGEAAKEAQDAANAATASASAAVNSQKAVAASDDDVRTAMKSDAIAPYYPDLEDSLKRTLDYDIATMRTLQDYVKQDADTAADEAKQAQAIAAQLADELKTNPPDKKVSKEPVIEAQQQAKNAADAASHAAGKQKIAQKIGNAIKNFKPNPPIDGLLHSVQFVVTYGVNITPSWTLLRWKGPGLTAPGAGATGQRTHILNIALGPTNEQNRLIQNITIANSGLGLR